MILIMEWNKSFCEEKNNWYDHAYSNFPYIISKEYSRLFSMLNDGEIYGCIFQIKDVFEVIIKYPILIAASVLVHKGNDEIAKYFSNPSKSLSLGDWVNDLVGEICKCPELDDEKGLKLKQLLKNTRKGFNKNNVVQWRNDKIGHGALEHKDDIELMCHRGRFFLTRPDL